MAIPKTLEEAKALHREVAARPVDVARLLGEARRALSDDRLNDAETLLTGALVADPDRSESWRLAARLAAEGGEVDEAEDLLRQALEIANDEEAALDLAVLMGSDGRFEEAEGMATVLALDAHSADVRSRADRLALEMAERRQR